jgi:hypothetical protein
MVRSSARAGTGRRGRRMLRFMLFDRLETGLGEPMSM